MGEMASSWTANHITLKDSPTHQHRQLMEIIEGVMELEPGHRGTKDLPHTPVYAFFIITCDFSIQSFTIH